MKRKRVRIRKFDFDSLSGADREDAERRKRKLLGLMRLIDMDTEEVSVVDRAANKEDFLVVKRDTEGGDPLKKNRKKFKKNPLTAALKSAASARLSGLIATLSEMLETVKAATGIEKSLEKPLPAFVGGGIVEAASRLGSFIEDPIAKSDDDPNKDGKTDDEGSGGDGGEGSEGGEGGEGEGAGEGSGADGGEGSGEDKAASETEKALKQETSSIQSLIMSKDRFKTAEAAQKWARDNGFKADKVDEPESGETFRLRQFDPSICKRIRTQDLTNGVKAALCIREAEKAFEIPSPVKDAVTRTLSGALEKASDVLESVLEAPITEDEAVLGDERVSELKAVGELLKGIGEKYPSEKALHDPEEDKRRKKKPKKTEKRGAKISAERMKKLVSLFEGLGGFLKDVGVSLDPKDVKKSLNGLEALDTVRSAIDPNHPNVGSGLQPDLDVVSDFKTSLRENPGLAATMKVAIAEIVKEETSQLKASLSKKDELIVEKDKAIEEKEGIIAKQARRIKSLEDETPAPRGQGGGEGGPVRKRDGEDDDLVFWPSDMNAGSKEEVKKAGIWFGKD